MEYPKDLRTFRKKALLHDGVFAPDIAFALRTCTNPACGNLYVQGTFPRLKREPFDSLESLHEILLTAIKKERPKTMFSSRLGRVIPRSCPICLAPEREGQPDKFFFCHVIPESGDDMQIEYDIKEGRLVLGKVWRMPKKSGDLLEYDEAIEVKLANESEDTIQNAFGEHFSLRAVWNEIFSVNQESAEVVYRKVSPGMTFIFKPEKVNKTLFQAFADKTLKPDRDKGVFNRLEPVIVKATDAAIPGSYKEWAPKFEPMLSAGDAECFVAISFDELKKAAKTVLATRSITLESTPGKTKKDPGWGFMSKAGLNLEIDFTQLGSRAAVSGLSLHEACALYLSDPVFALESAARLEDAFKKALPGCFFQIVEGHVMMARDKKGQERRIDLGNLANKLDPENKYLFNLYLGMLLTWDEKTNGFGTPPAERDVSPAGLPAFVDRRIRPKGHLQEAKKPDALFEPREDSDGNRYDLCYTSECTQTLVFIDPSTQKFKGLTLEDVQQLYERMGGVLPMYIAKMDSLTLPGRVSTLKGPEKQREFPCKALLLYGMDLASLGADPKRATELANVAGLILDEDARIHLYALASDSVVLSPRRLSPDELKMAQSRMAHMLEEIDTNPGIPMSLHFDVPKSEPKGYIIKKTR